MSLSGVYKYNDLEYIIPKSNEQCMKYNKLLCTICFHQLLSGKTYNPSLLQETYLVAPGTSPGSNNFLYQPRGKIDVTVISLIYEICSSITKLSNKRDLSMPYSQFDLAISNDDVVDFSSATKRRLSRVQILALGMDVYQYF